MIFACEKSAGKAPKKDTNYVHSSLFFQTKAPAAGCCNGGFDVFGKGLFGDSDHRIAGIDGSVCHGDNFLAVGGVGDDDENGVVMTGFGDLLA